jgi:DNA damage-binding protein 1
MDIGTANATLERIATWNHNYLVTSLASRADRILVGDAISSISVLRLEDNRLHLVARDYGALWPTSVELMSDSTLIGANVSCRMFLMSLFAFTLLCSERIQSLYIQSSAFGHAATSGERR